LEKVSTNSPFGLWGSKVLPITKEEGNETASSSLRFPLLMRRTSGTGVAIAAGAGCVCAILLVAGTLKETVNPRSELLVQQHARGRPNVLLLAAAVRRRQQLGAAAAAIGFTQPGYGETPHFGVFG